MGAHRHQRAPHRPASPSTRAHRQMSTPKPVCPNMATATPLGPPEPRRRRSSTPGSSSGTRSHPPLASVFPRARHGRSLSRCGELTFRTPTRHRAPNQEPGRILIPGDGAAGDQEAPNRLAYPTWRPRDACSLSCHNDFLTPWSQSHTPSCNRQAKSTSIHVAKPGPANAPRGHSPLQTDKLSLARTISDRRLFARRWKRLRLCLHAHIVPFGAAATVAGTVVRARPDAGGGE